MTSAPDPAETTTVRLAYGSTGLRVELPAALTTVVWPEHHPAVADVDGELRRALQAPVAGPRLRELVRPQDRVAVSICDITRAQPRRQMLEAVLDELDGVVPLDQLSVLIATGTHRANTPAELGEMLGADLLDRLQVSNHDCRDQTALTWVGRIGDVPVWLSSRWVEADVKITTGFVEPHFFAGFSGGPKMVAPGLAGLETVLALHDARRIGSERATWGVIEGNPVHDDIRAIAAATGVDFAFDVVLNRDQQIVKAFSGELFAMHAEACSHARATAMRPVSRRFDIVVTTNSGYPLDQSLYQSVKGMSAAAEIVKPGGLIICAAECRDGFPSHGGFRAELASAPDLAALARRIEARPDTRPDQWQVQVLARMRARARIALYADGLSDSEIREAHLEPTRDIAALVRAELAARGEGARVCVLPEGPQTIAYLAEPTSR